MKYIKRPLTVIIISNGVSRQLSLIELRPEQKHVAGIISMEGTCAQHVARAGCQSFWPPDRPELSSPTDSCNESNQLKVSTARVCQRVVQREAEAVRSTVTGRTAELMDSLIAWVAVFHQLQGDAQNKQQSILSRVCIYG